MKKTLILTLILALCLMSFACAKAPSGPFLADAAAERETPSANATQAPSVPEDDGEQLTQALSVWNGDKAVQALDIRDAAAYASGHLPHALRLEEKDFASRALALLPLKNTQLLVYGDGTHSATHAAETLKGLGYLFVYPLEDLAGWPDALETGAWAEPADKAQTFASFIASDLSGLWVDESLFADHDLTMINIWGTFCGPCLMEMPDLGDLNREYADRGFQIVGIVVDALNADGSIPMSIVEKARAIVDETGADYVHLLPTEQLVTAKIDQVMYVPETIFVNSKGEIVGESFVGSHSREEWEAIIQQYLAQVKGQ